MCAWLLWHIHLSFGTTGRDCGALEASMSMRRFGSGVASGRVVGDISEVVAY
jgi:hypothetical protein